MPSEMRFSNEKKRFALENHLGQQFFEDLEQTLDRAPNVIHTPDQRLTTQAAVLRELDTVLMVLDGRGQVGAVASTTLVDEFLTDQGLITGQETGIRLAATTCDAFIAWQGVAGAGKSYALKLFRRIAEAQGYQVRCFALSAEAAKTSGESAQIQQTETVAALLHSQLNKNHQSTSLVNEYRHQTSKEHLAVTNHHELD
ncbi:MAG: AAA family ATPase [Cyanobacteria bacterium J06635_1]